MSKRRIETEEMESSEEEDYMSLDLYKLEEEHNKIVKEKEKYNKKMTKKSKPVVTKHVNANEAKEQLLEKLNEPIKKDNVGFKLLQKMGFNPEKTTAPVKIELKGDNKGLGLVSHELEKLKEKRDTIMKMETKQNESYKKIQKKRFEKKTLLIDLIKCLNTTRQLDEDSSIRSNPLWLPFFNEMGELMEIEMEDDSIEEMLLKLIDYLRDTYYYCIYCGIQFNDEKDMIDNCYGKLRADHDE